MNRKKVAWLLTAAMVATSVDSSALVASGADFSSEPVENMQEFSDGAESQDEGEAVSAEAEAPQTEQEEAPEAVQEPEQEADSDLALEDETEELSEPEEQEENTSDDSEELTEPEPNNEAEAFSSDDKDLEVQSEIMDSSMAENAIDLPYKNFIDISDVSSEDATVFRFSVEKNGKYKIVLSSVNTDHIMIYDSSFKECEVEDTNIVSCQAGETYYAVYNFSYVSDNAAAGVFPTIESFQMEQMPKTDYTLWGDGPEIITGEGAVVSCTYSNGETEELSDGDDINMFPFVMIGNEEYGYTDEPGTYQANLLIKKNVNGTNYDLYCLKNIGQIRLQTLKSWVQSRKDDAIELSGEEEENDAGMTDQLFHFRPEKNGLYSLFARGEEGNENIYSYQVLMDGDFNVIEQIDHGQTSRRKLEAGKDYYLAVRNEIHDQLYAGVSSAKEVKSIEIKNPEVSLCMGKDSLKKEDLLSNEMIQINYTDGTENVETCYGSVSEGYDIEIDTSSVDFDEDGNAKEGEYTVTVSVADQKTEVKIKVQKFADFFNERAEELTLDQERSTAISKKGSYYYKFTAPEDGTYTFRYRAMEDGEETGDYSYSVSYFDSEGNGIEETTALKAGDVVYARMTSEYDTGYDFCIKAIQKNYMVSSLKVESEPSDKTYIERLEFRDSAQPKTEGLKIRVAYDDGVEEVLGAEDVSRDGSKLSIYLDDDYDEDENGEEIRNYQLYIELDGSSVTVPVNYMTLAQYIRTLDKNYSNTLKLDEDETVQWNGGKGYLYSFTPDKDGEYSFTSEGNVDTYGYLVDENGEILAENDEDGSGNNFKVIYTLTAGTTYYYLARPYNSSKETSTLKLYKKESIASVDIEKPKKTNYISGFDSGINYDGLKISITFDSGKEVTYTYGDDDFGQYINISDNFAYDNSGNIQPGDYALTLTYEEENIGSIPVKCQSFADYMSEHQPGELKIGEDITETRKDDEDAFYKFTASETGKYKFKVTGTKDENQYYDSRLDIYNENGDYISEHGHYGEMSIELEAGTTYYLRINYRSYTEDDVDYTISVQAQRTLKEMVLNSNEIDLYEGFDDFSYDRLWNLARELEITLKFTDGSEETVHCVEDTTEDGYRVSVEDIPDLDGTPGTYNMKFRCGDISIDYKINLHSALDYIAKNASEIQSGKRTPVKIQSDSTAVYYAVVPETGYYKISYLANTSARIKYYDQEGEYHETPVKVEKGQKFYFSLENTEERSIRALVTVEKQDVVLEKLTIKTPPLKTTVTEVIDYLDDYDISDFDAEGMTVTAQYTDGMTEDLKPGDTSRLGSELSVNLSPAYDGDGNENFALSASMDEVRSEFLQISRISFKDYLKENGNQLETLKVNKDKNIMVQRNKCQVYGFTAENDGTYTFYSTGDEDTYGYIYDSEGQQIAYNDDAGSGTNFQIQLEMKKGEKYYLAARTFSSGAVSTTIHIADENGSEGASALSDFKLEEEPEKTVFYAYNDENNLNIWDLSYEGLKISAKTKEGETEIYSYSRSQKEFPFTITNNIKTDENGRPLTGKYTITVSYNGKTAVEFPIELKSFEDYLAGITNVLKPGEALDKVAEDPTEDGNLCYVKLPADLKGIYWNSGDRNNWSVYGIYDIQGKKTDMQLGNSSAWDFGGKDYYLCLKDKGYDDENGIFRYEKMASSGIIKDMEIISQPENTEFLKGMNAGIDVTGMMLRITYEDDTQKKVSATEFSDIYNRELSIVNEKGERIFNVSDLHDGENDLSIQLWGIKKNFRVSLTDPAKKDLDTLALDENAAFSVSESVRSHVYSYIPDEDGEFYFNTEAEHYSSSWADENLKWYCTDEEENYLTDEEGNLPNLKKGKKYYFVVYYDGSAFGDVSVQLHKVSGSGEDVTEEDTDVVDMEITAPTKVEYTPEEKISYDGIKIHAIYDDGTEKDYTLEEAQKKGFTVSDTVKSLSEKNCPGSYEIVVRHEGQNGFSVRKTVPITVKNTGVLSGEFSENEQEIEIGSAEPLYEYQVAEDGYYQLELTAKNNSFVEGYITEGDNHQMLTCNGDGRKTAYSSLMYLKAGKHYINFRSEMLSGGSCGVKLYHYSAAPQRIEVIPDSVKTEFIYGRDAVNFEGMKVRITYADGTERIVTVPEGFGRSGIMESGLYINNASDWLGNHELYLYIDIEDQENSRSISSSLKYTVKYPGDTVELEIGKTYTVKADSMKKQSVIYKIKGSELDNELCRIQYSDSRNTVHVGMEDGSYMENVWPQYTDGTGEVCFIARKDKTYIVSIAQDEDVDEDMTIKLAGKNSVTKITPLPEDKTSYYYGIQDSGLENMKIQLTYADGNTEVVNGQDERIWLFGLDMEEISGPGTYSGILSFGSIRTLYRREIKDLSSEEIKKDQEVKLTGEDARNFKFVPEKTQKYYMLINTSYDDADIRCMNTEGARLGYWVIRGNAEDRIRELVLTAGKTYYFNITCNNNGGNFVISDQKLSNIQVETGSTYTYTGTEIRPEAKVTCENRELTEGKDYQISYSNNVNAGTGQIEITPVEGGIRFAQKTVSFEITPQSLADEKVEVTTIPDQEYTGEELVPEIQVSIGTKTLTLGTDYRVSYENNTNPGTAEVTVEGLGNYCGTVMRTFKIVKTPKDFTKAEVSGIKTSYEYTGKSITPVPVVKYENKTLTAGTDYKVSYKNNTNPGTAEITVEGMGDYRGTVTRNFKIVKTPKDFTKAAVSGIKSSYDYTGKNIKPVPVVKYANKVLTAGKDYDVAYVNNTKVGKATITITGKGDYSGKKSVTFTIAYKLVSKITMNRSSATVLAGNSLQLKATATPSNAYNKTVTWKSSSKYVTVDKNGKVTVNAKAPGGTVVTITATANDSSKKSASCKITVHNKITYSLNGGTQNKNNKTSFCKQTVKLYNPTRKGYIFGGWYTDKNLKKKITAISSKTTANVTLYAKWTKVSACKAPAKVTLKNSKAKTMTASWDAVSGANGYEFSYAENTKFTKAVKKVQTGRTVNIANLVKGKNYYVRVRAYRTDSTGAKIYGSYSKTVKVKIAK